MEGGRERGGVAREIKFYTRGRWRLTFGVQRKIYLFRVGGKERLRRRDVALEIRDLIFILVRRETKSGARTLRGGAARVNARSEKER